MSQAERLTDLMVFGYGLLNLKPDIAGISYRFCKILFNKVIVAGICLGALPESGCKTFLTIFAGKAHGVERAALSRTLGQYHSL